MILQNELYYINYYNDYMYATPTLLYHMIYDIFDNLDLYAAK